MWVMSHAAVMAGVAVWDGVVGMECVRMRSVGGANGEVGGRVELAVALLIRK